ncbi:MAG: helix-turn-helix domain-containing protein [Tannerellaceae bacterium]|nr:helix-turn-helix domain-containing protein [Tannerellaceae bacterium]
MKKNDEQIEKSKKYLIELGKQIREVRNLKGLTQETLADMAKIDSSYLSEIETGK